MTTRTARLWKLAAVLLVLTGLSACGGDDDGSAGGSGEESDAAANDEAAPSEDAVTVATKEFEFTPSDLSLEAGTHEVVVDNSGGVIEHDFTIDDLGIQIYAGPGEVVGEDVELESGTYDFWCSIPGHRDSGMEGTLTVG